MTVLCHCNVITDKDVKATLEAHAKKIEAMPSNKAAAFIFNSLRDKATEEARCRSCPKPCIASIEGLIIEEEAKALSCKGYRSAGGCAAADVIAGLLHEMK